MEQEKIAVGERWTDSLNVFPEYVSWVDEAASLIN